MTPPRAFVAVRVGVAVMVVVVAVGVAVWAGGGTPARASGTGGAGGPGGASGRTIHLTAHHSHWSTDHLTVPARTRIRIVVRNEDPIDHELIVGDGAVQDRHERGTEARHPPRPGEITIPAGSTVETTVWFPQPGPLLFGCHLPGHWAYGMHGTITVTAT